MEDETPETKAARLLNLKKQQEQLQEQLQPGAQPGEGEIDPLLVKFHHNLHAEAAAPLESEPAVATPRYRRHHHHHHHHHHHRDGPHEALMPLDGSSDEDSFLGGHQSPSSSVASYSYTGDVAGTASDASGARGSSRLGSLGHKTSSSSSSLSSSTVIGASEEDSVAGEVILPADLPPLVPPGGTPSPGPKRMSSGGTPSSLAGGSPLPPISTEGATAGAEGTGGGAGRGDGDSLAAIVPPLNKEPSDQVVFRSGDEMAGLSEEAEQSMYRLCGRFQFRVMQPRAPFVRTWNYVVFLAIVYNAVSVPYLVSMADRSVFTLPFLLVNIVMDIVYVLDIAANALAIGYYSDGHLDLNKSHVLGHYLSNYAAVDTLSVLPIDYIMLGINPELAVTFRFTRMLRMSRLPSFFASWEHYSSSPTVFRLLKLMLVLAFAVHVVACSFLLLLRFERESGLVLEDDFVWFPGMREFSPFKAYMYSLFWTYTLMTGLGPEHAIIPSSNAEMTFTFSAIVIGLFLFALIVGGLSELMQARNAHHLRFRKKMDAINTFMLLRNVPQDLQDRIRSYYEYLWFRQQGVDDQSVLNAFPRHLRTEVSMCLNQSIVESVPMFKQCDDISFIRALVPHLRPEIYAPGDFIVREGEAGDGMYFVKRGEVDIILPDGSTCAQRGEGEFFGEVAVLLPLKRTASVMARTVVDVFKLSKEDVDKVLETYPEHADMLKNVAYKRLARGHAAMQAKKQALSVVSAFRAAGRAWRAKASSSGVTDQVIETADGVGIAVEVASGGEGSESMGVTSAMTSPAASEAGDDPGSGVGSPPPLPPAASSKPPRAPKQPPPMVREDSTRSKASLASSRGGISSAGSIEGSDAFSGSGGGGGSSAQTAAASINMSMPLLRMASRARKSRNSNSSGGGGGGGGGAHSMHESDSAATFLHQSGGARGLDSSAPLLNVSGPSGGLSQTRSMESVAAVLGDTSIPTLLRALIELPAGSLAASMVFDELSQDELLRLLQRLTEAQTGAHVALEYTIGGESKASRLTSMFHKRRRMSRVFSESSQ